jgi:hypothetical protein
MVVIKMSILKTIRQSLEENPKVVVVKVLETNYLPHKDPYGWAHTVDFMVAPRGRGIYTAEELQEFMMSLVPEGLQPTSKDNFFQYSSGSLEFGKLYFDEVIGKEKIIGTLFDEELSNVNGFVNGQITIEEPYKRRIWIRPFPSEAYVRDLPKGKPGVYEYCAEPEALEKYQKSERSLLSRIIGKH